MVVERHQPRARRRPAGDVRAPLRTVNPPTGSDKHGRAGNDRGL